MLNGFQKRRELLDPRLRKGGIVADIIAVKVHVIDLWVSIVFFGVQTAEVGLAQLVSPTLGATPMFHLCLAHGGLDPIPVIRICLADHQSKGVVATALQSKIRAEFTAVQPA